ncbi:MAG: SGNH/GDSL hydrolase family protein, partial [Micrococcales bacterium]|nr:SGNH/GDSL hydrolase family protein [Micrococcales bacterium]
TGGVANAEPAAGPARIAAGGPIVGEQAAPAPAAAEAVGGSRLVVFGDSIAAGTNLLWQEDERECMHGEDSWPKRLAETMGVLGTPDFVDASCWGSVIDKVSDNWTFADQVRWADKQDALGPDTEVVLVGLGLNDMWGNEVDGLLPAITDCALNFIDGCDRDAAAQNRVPDASAVTPDAYASRIEQVIAYLKYYAPNAQIALVGYPEMTPQRGDELCLKMAGVPVVQPRGGALVDHFAALDNAQRGAAQKLGLKFVDVRSASSGHGPCNPDPWMNELLDAQELLGVPFHLTRRGEALLADLVVWELGL